MALGISGDVVVGPGVRHVFPGHEDLLHGGNVIVLSGLLEDMLRQGSHREPLVHGSFPHLTVGFGLGATLGLGQILLGFQDLPVLPDLPFRVGGLFPDFLQPLALGVGHLDGGQQRLLLNGFDQIPGDPGCAGPFDDLTVAESGEKDDTFCQVLFQDGLRGGQTVKNGHLYIHEDHIGVEGTAEFDGIKTVRGLTDHRETQLLEHVRQVHSGDGLVVHDDHFFQTVSLHLRVRSKHKLTKPKFCGMLELYFLNSSSEYS